MAWKESYLAYVGMAVSGGNPPGFVSKAGSVALQIPSLAVIVFFTKAPGIHIITFPSLEMATFEKSLNKPKEGRKKNPKPLYYYCVTIE